MTFEDELLEKLTRIGVALEGIENILGYIWRDS